MFDKWLKTIQSTVFGARCALCHAPAPAPRVLCRDCTQDLPYLDRSCRHCALALPAAAGTEVCLACARRTSFDTGIAVFAYREPIRWMIGRLKFDARVDFARALGDFLADHIIAANVEAPEALVPIPLHPIGYRRRGFNQAELIARRVARRLHRPVAGDAIARVRDTARQSELAAAARAANMRGAFACRRPLSYRHVAVVDDVVTTTQTATVAATRLRAAGATRVDLYCVARA